VIVGAVSALGVLFAAVTIDRANPPDLSRYQRASPEVVARDGSLLRAYLSKDGYWRLKTNVRDVNPRYLVLLKAYEDKRFDDHFGVDPFALARAVFQLGSSGHIVSGASTLSMQAARLLEPEPRSIGTKLFQMARALQLEERYSKDQILSIYLTLAPFGGNLEGVRAASLAYFGKEPAALTLSQSALLVALPQSPERQRPDRHAIAAKAGRDKVLDRMVADGTLTPSDVAAAKRDGVAFFRQAMPLNAPYLADRLMRQYKNRTRIVTTLDVHLQAAVERMVKQESAYFGDGAALAIVAVDNKTHAVLAYVGGADYWGGNGGNIDLAAQPRSPGSALKPFIYGLGFDDLILHPATLMVDQPTLFGDYAPRDFEGTYQGQVTAGDALRMSLNIPAVALLDRVGPLRFTLALTNAGATLSLPTKDATPSLPMALGGLGITLSDITMLYTGIADAGVVWPLRFTQDQPQGAEHHLFGAVPAWYLRDILIRVGLPDGWAQGQGLARKHQVAFKTGTSYGYRDAWAMGFTSDYTVGVWVGRADGAPRPGHIGRESAAPILLRTFELLPADKHGMPPPPAGAILARSPDSLPAGLRVFHREQRPELTLRTVATIPAPTIAFPPNGATIPLPKPNDKDQTIALKADGGREPLTWLVNGQIVGSYGRFAPALYAPSGEGFAKVTVVDSAGRSDSAQVRFKRMQ
jgi:penicillin-binding protein 1C